MHTMSFDQFESCASGLADERPATVALRAKVAIVSIADDPRGIAELPVCLIAH